MAFCSPTSRLLKLVFFCCPLLFFILESSNTVPGIVRGFSSWYKTRRLKLDQSAEGWEERKASITLQLNVSLFQHLVCAPKIQKCVRGVCVKGWLRSPPPMKCERKYRSLSTARPARWENRSPVQEARKTPRLSQEVHEGAREVHVTWGSQRHTCRSGRG